MLRLLLLLSLRATTPAHASTRVYWVDYLETALREAPAFVPEVRSFASACGLRESRFYDFGLPVHIVRPEGEAWWISVLTSLATDPPHATDCDWDVLFAMLPRPWNHAYVQQLRDALWGEQTHVAIRRLAQARLLGALPVKLTPEENSRAVHVDRELANILLGDRPDPSMSHARPEIDGLLNGARALETGSMRLLPRAAHFQCASVISYPLLLQRDEMKNFDSLVLSLRR